MEKSKLEIRRLGAESMSNVSIFVVLKRYNTKTKD
jgi:hypothetical protein